jgi:hypothetical protein
MTGRGAIFDREKEQAVDALLSHGTIEEAAGAAGVGYETLVSWLKIPEFRTDYREARRAAFGQSIMRLQQASGAAVDTLLRIMEDPEAPAACRLRAAESVLQHAADGIAIEDLEARVAALEAVNQE